LRVHKISHRGVGRKKKGQGRFASVCAALEVPGKRGRRRRRVAITQNGVNAGVGVRGEKGEMEWERERER
jgi:hypothetical protein